MTTHGMDVTLPHYVGVKPSLPLVLSVGSPFSSWKTKPLHELLYRDASLQYLPCSPYTAGTKHLGETVPQSPPPRVVRLSSSGNERLRRQTQQPSFVRSRERKCSAPTTSPPTHHPRPITAQNSQPGPRRQHVLLARVPSQTVACSIRGGWVGVVGVVPLLLAACVTLPELGPPPPPDPTSHGQAEIMDGIPTTVVWPPKIGGRFAYVAPDIHSTYCKLTDIPTADGYGWVTPPCPCSWITTTWRCRGDGRNWHD